MFLSPITFEAVLTLIVPWSVVMITLQFSSIDFLLFQVKESCRTSFLVNDLYALSFDASSLIICISVLEWESISTKL